MTSRNAGHPQRRQLSAQSARRFGPWPWYLSAADVVGLDIDVVDDIAGDFVEECSAVTGAARFAKRAWCAGQALRALPHLAMSTLRRGGRRERLRLVCAISLPVLVAASVLTALQLHVGPPARLAADRGFFASNIVINNFNFVQMPIHALDARGHTVSNAVVRYTQVSGDRIALSPTGAVACAARGDAIVRATVDHVTSLIGVHCRPVTHIHTDAWNDFLPGDPPRVVHIEATGADGKVVNELRGSVRVLDTNVAVLRHNVLIPRGAGGSSLAISVGDMRLQSAVVVHEIVARFDNLSPAQRHVAIPLRIPLGDTLHFAVPAGILWVKWMARDGSTAHPAITAEGPGYCHVGSDAFIRWLPAGEYGAYCYVSSGARIRVARGSAGDSLLTGALLLERMSQQ